MIFILIIIFLVFIFWRLSFPFAFKGDIGLNHNLFIGLGFLLYSVFYLLEKSLKNLFTDDVWKFGLNVSLALFFFVLGKIIAMSIVSKYQGKIVILNPVNYRKQVSLKTISGKSVLIFFGFLFILLHIYMQLVFGGWYIYFTQVYGEFKSDGINSFTVIIPLLCSSFVLIFNSPLYCRSIRTTRVVSILSIFIILIFFLGGNRNLGMMVGVSFLYSKFLHRNVNIFKFLPFLILAIIITSINAIGRQYGLINFLAGDIDVPFDVAMEYILSVSNGEFGTMARVENFHREFNFELRTFPGFSYFISPIVSLFPSFFWAGRPNTIAVEFTRQYWGGLTEGTVGLGFSPILEAELNFGMLWPIVFLFISFIIHATENLFLVKSYKLYYYFFGSFSAVCLNFYRIDFALTFKFMFLIFFLSILVDTLISRRVSDGAFRK